MDLDVIHEIDRLLLEVRCILEFNNYQKYLWDSLLNSLYDEKRGLHKDFSKYIRRYARRLEGIKTATNYDCVGLSVKLKQTAKYIDNLKYPPQFEGNDELKPYLEEILRCIPGIKIGKFPLKTIEYFYMVDKERYLSYIGKIMYHVIKSIEEIEETIKYLSRFGHNTEIPRSSLRYNMRIKGMVERCMEYT